MHQLGVLLLAAILSVVAASQPQHNLRGVSADRNADVVETNQIERRLEEHGLAIHIYSGDAPVPLGECEGDCDTDDDCEGNLMCFQRERYDSVPGCRGGSEMWSHADVCIVPPTASPSVPPSSLPGSDTLYAYSGTPPESAFPLPRCTGDCDSDDDCGPGLVCFFRTRYQEVPGCIGGADDWSQTDYCVEPFSNSPTNHPTPRPSQSPSSVPPTNAIFSYPGDPPTSAYPLRLCTGDCDSDDDCGEGLVCFQRERNQAVPGCAGGEEDWSVTDYCIVAATSSKPSATPTKNPTRYPTSMPSQSLGGSTPVLFSYPDVPPASAYPLPVCTGDCDSDDDCEEGLVCFSRDRYEEVPGCTGGSEDWSRTDYCTYPLATSTPTGVPTKSPTSTPSVYQEPTSSPAPSVKSLFLYKFNPPPEAFPLGFCEGDCDTDTDCADGLVCFQRGRYEAVPGCDGGEEMYSRSDFCIIDPNLSSAPSTQPSSSPTASPTITLPSLVTYDGVNPPDDALPLGMCTGDCDSDIDCGEDLFCYERDAGERVPGCSGGYEELSGKDYCTSVAFAPAKPTNSSYFRLAVASQDKDWCMSCKNDCDLGDVMYLRDCSGRSAYFELTLLGWGEALIEVSGTSLCLERRNLSSEISLYLASCNSGKTRQRFGSMDGTTPFTADTFEITQNGYHKYCIQPAAAEFASDVSMGNCTLARSKDVSEWKLV
eukprot:Nitzschia sp. Nitz4//NODE_293_length_29386_cov_71.949235//2837//4960//NITZ4_additional_000031-RA//-1//CDS//3329531815//5066//frame0